MKPEDFIGPACSCAECTQADIAGKETRRDPRSGKWLHGYALRRWYEARDRFEALRKQVQPKVMR